MVDARGQTVTVRVGAAARDGRDAEFGVSGTVITDPGFLAAYEEGRDDDAAGERDDARILPPLREGQHVAVEELTPQGHQTTPPPRYTEATLVKALEERGIGRPSTYAQIISTIIDRGYVVRRGSALVPTWLAFAVTRLLEAHFGRLVDYDFTAQMEEDLDRIAAGDEDRVAWLTRFYFGGPDGARDELGGLKRLVASLGDIDPREVNTIPIGDGIVVRVGRYGPYLERGDERAPLPEDLAPDELTVAKAQELLAAPSGDRELGVDPATGHQIVARTGRFGPYVTEVPAEEAPKGKAAKPRTASLLASMSLDTVTLDDALRLLSLPRLVGVDPETGEEILAANGRYGPYLKRGTQTRSLEDEEQLFTVTLDQARALFAAPKQRGRRRPAAPRRELGTDPATGRAVTVREGRFGPYVTDGETNATLRAGDEPDTVSLERASALLAEKRAAGPRASRRSTGTGRGRSGGATAPREGARPGRRAG
jgi:DNA topoisomerase-1